MKAPARFVLIAAMLATLAAYAWHGWYGRYVRDDYCTATNVRDRGVIGSALFFHKTWSGRFSYYLVKGSLEAIGPSTARVVPALLIAGLLAAAIFATRSLLGGVTLTFATFASSPDVLAWGGPLTWETGSITYTLPLVLFTLWFGLFHEPGVRKAVLGGALMLVAGGMSETSLAAQGILTGGIVLLTYVKRDRARFLIAAWGLAGSILALAILGTAPGNRIRLASSPTPPPIAAAITNGLGYAHTYIGWHVFVDGEALLVVIAVAGILSSRMQPRTAVIIGLIAGVAYLATFLPAAWSLSTAPPPRALHVSNYCLIVMLACFASACGRRFTGFARNAGPILLLLTVIPILTTIQLVRRIPAARLEASQIDRITQALQASRGHVVVRSRWAHTTNFAAPDPKEWMNDCLCRYYGAKSLRIER